METKMAKLGGWLLLALGVGIILGTLYYSYRIFTAQVLVPTIFSLDKKGGMLAGEKIDKPLDLTGGEPLELQVEEMLQSALQEQLENFVPSDVVVKMLNLVAWSICAGILIFGATQVAKLGIKLIK